MVPVKVEFLMWQGRDLGPEVVRPDGDTRARLETEVEEGATVGELFRQLAARYPAVKEMVFPGDRLSPYMVATLNSDGLSREELLERPVQPGDLVSVFPIIIGGQRAM